VVKEGSCIRAAGGIPEHGLRGGDALLLALEAETRKAKRERCLTLSAHGITRRRSSTPF
jgi:hypothetical protein